MIYHMEVSTLSRGKGRSLGASLSYISGKKIHDSYSGRNHHHRRTRSGAMQGVLSSGRPQGACGLSSTSVMSSTRRRSGRTPAPDACSSALCQTNWRQASGRKSSRISSRKTLWIGDSVRWLPSTEESRHLSSEKQPPCPHHRLNTDRGAGGVQPQKGSGTRQAFLH